jgi:hypothetical protein
VAVEPIETFAGRSFTAKESGTTARRPTKRAPDAGESGAISSLFLRLSIFPVGRRPAARPSAGNASRWASGHLKVQNNILAGDFISLQFQFWVSYFFKSKLVCLQLVLLFIFIAHFLSFGFLRLLAS